MKINGVEISKESRPYIIAEMSGNHNGIIDNALKIIRSASAAGASAIKLQTYTADTLTIDSSKEDFVITDGLWKNRTLYELYQEASTPWEWHSILFEEARKIGITIFSSPFDNTAIEFLEELDAPAYKIASFELTDLELIKSVALTGKPLILSTGMANLKEIEEAYETVIKYGSGEVALLHCVSGYPTPYKDSNLKTIVDLESKFHCPIGLSDHTLGTAVSSAAIALGACIIEKHIVLSREDHGVDSAFSITPEEFKQLVEDCRIVRDSVGHVNYEQKDSEKLNIKFRRSLYVVQNIKAGEIITRENVKSIRPGYGLEPKHLPSILGAKALKNLEIGQRITWDVIGPLPEK